MNPRPTALTYEQWIEKFIDLHVIYQDRAKAKLALQALLAAVSGEIQLARLSPRGKR